MYWKLLSPGQFLFLFFYGIIVLFSMTITVSFSILLHNVYCLKHCAWNNALRSMVVFHLNTARCYTLQTCHYIMFCLDLAAPKWPCFPWNKPSVISEPGLVCVFTKSPCRRTGHLLRTFQHIIFMPQAHVLLKPKSQQHIEITALNSYSMWCSIM